MVPYLIKCIPLSLLLLQTTAASHCGIGRHLRVQRSGAASSGCWFSLTTSLHYCSTELWHDKGCTSSSVTLPSQNKVSPSLPKNGSLMDHTLILFLEVRSLYVVFLYVPYKFSMFSEIELIFGMVIELYAE